MARRFRYKLRIFIIASYFVCVLQSVLDLFCEVLDVLSASLFNGELTVVVSSALERRLVRIGWLYGVSIQTLYRRGT